MEKEIVFKAVRAEVRTSRLDLGEPSEFPKLLAIAADALHGAGIVDTAPNRLRSLTGMALLGPPTGLPEDEMCCAVELLAGKHAEEGDHSGLLDLAAAYGCGWRRNRISRGGGWDGVWPGALTFVVKKVRKICRAVYWTLRNDFHVRLPGGVEALQLIDITALDVTNMLIDPISAMTPANSIAFLAGGTDDDPNFAGIVIWRRATTLQRIGRWRICFVSRSRSSILSQIP